MAYDPRQITGENLFVIFFSSFQFLSFLVCGEVEALELVLEAGALASTPDIHGGYPVHYAAQMCGPHSEMGPSAARHGLAVLRKLLHSGVGVNVTDRDGRQPILWAASAGKYSRHNHILFQ